MSLVATREEAILSSRINQDALKGVQEKLRTGMTRMSGLPARCWISWGSGIRVEMLLGTGLPASTVFNPDKTTLIGHCVQDAAKALSVQDMLSTIREAFGMNVKQIANSLHITRPTYYEWIKDQTAPTLQPDSRDRLNELFHLSKAWKTMPQIPGNYLHERIDPLGASMEELLQNKAISLQDLALANTALLATLSEQERRQAYLARQKRALTKAAKNILANPGKFGVILD